MPKSDTGAAAVDYIRRGLAIIALCPHKKNPSFKNGLKDATTCVEDVEEWYEAYPDDNVAIVTGAVSGNIGVIDIDVDDECDKDGYSFLNRWEREHGELPETWTVTTARGGCHMYYRFRDSVPRNSANEDIAIDFRGEGGYVMAPPSIHPNGRRVEWELPPEDVDLAWANDNVMEFLKTIRKTEDESERFELPEKIGKGARDISIFKYACSLQSLGRPDWEIEAAVRAANKNLCDPPLTDAEVTAKIESALRYEKGKSIDLTTVTLSRPDGVIQLEAGRNGAIKQTISNCITVLEFDNELKDRFVYDESAYTRMKRLPLPWRGGSGYERVRDSDYIELASYMETRYGLTHKNKVEDALIAVSERNPVNPKKDWLNSLQWDGIDRLQSIATDVIGCENTPYNQEIIKLFMWGCVARIYQPGCKFDYMLVLYGPQGIGKSTFVRRLAMRPEWYLDNMTEFGGDEAANLIRGKWIIEIAELQAFSKKDVNQIKAYCSQQYEDTRPKYGRESEQRPRQCCFIGTTNSNDFLTDKTGNRRFLILECGSVKPKVNIFDDSCVPYFEQCWAQAADEWKRLKPPLVISPAFLEDAEANRNSFMVDDPRVGLIEAYLNSVIATDERGSIVCVASIAENALGMDKREYSGNNRFSREIGEIMNHQIKGWKSVGRKYVSQYGRQRAWVPEESGEVAQILANADLI